MRRSQNRSRVIEMSEEPFNDKENQFNNLWDGITPKGVNRVKALKFRQYILEHVRQMRRPMNRDNALKYWMGELKADSNDAENF